MHRNESEKLHRNNVVKNNSVIESYTYLSSDLSLLNLQVLVEVPYIMAQAGVYGIIVYSMIGFKWTVVKFLWYVYFMFFTFLYFTFYGMLSVAVTPNADIASIVAAAFYALWNLFSGFIIPRPVSS